MLRAGLSLRFQALLARCGLCVTRLGSDKRFEMVRARQEKLCPKRNSEPGSSMCMQKPSVCIYIYIYMYVHMFFYIYIYIHIYLHIYIYVYTYIHEDLCIYLYALFLHCTYIYIYIHIYIYIYVYESATFRVYLTVLGFSTVRK